MSCLLFRMSLISSFINFPVTVFSVNSLYLSKPYIDLVSFVSLIHFPSHSRVRRRVRFCIILRLPEPLLLEATWPGRGTVYGGDWPRSDDNAAAGPTVARRLWVQGGRPGARWARIPLCSGFLSAAAGQVASEGGTHR